MTTLIKKEHFTNKQATLILIVIAVFYFPFMIIYNEAIGIVTLIFIWTAIIPLVYFFRDQKLNGLPLTCSLPVTRQKVVAAKYISSWILLFSFMLLSIIISIFILSILGYAVNRIFAGATFYTFLRGFFVISVFLGFLFPLAFRYGTIAGFIVAGVVLNLIGVLLFLLKKVLFGSSEPIEDFVKFIYSWFAAAANFLLTQLGESAFVVFVILLIILVNYLSYKLSVVLFKRRDL